MDQTSLEQLRSDLISVLLHIETRINALEYCLLPANQPLTEEGIKALQMFAQEDAEANAAIRRYLETTIRKISE
jgi:predicted RNA-binding protein with EMAP domain